MKQSTFSAQVANNLLTLLQGYSKTIRLLLVMFLTLTVSANAWGEEGDTHDFAQSLSQLLNNNATISSITIDQQSYAVKEVKVTCRYNKTAGGATMTVSVGGTSWGSQTHNSSATTTYSFTGTATTGAIQIDFTNNCGSGTRKGTFEVLNVQLVEGAPANPYTVTLNAGPGTCAVSVTEASAGAGVTLPTPTLNCGDWTFAGWAEASVSTETTEEPTLIPAGNYKPTASTTLYAVYQRTEGGGGIVSWNKITTAPADWSGEYMIVNSDYAMTSDFKSGTSGEFVGANVTIANNNQVTTSPSDKMIWIVEKNGSTAQYSFKNKSTGTYANITGTSSTNAALSANAIWFTISSSSTSGVWKINSVTYSARCFAYYSSNKTFRTYANNSNTTGSLYRKEGSGSTTYYHSTPDCGSTEPSQLATPTGLSATNITSSSATLSWNAVDNASSYIVTIVDGGSHKQDYSVTGTTKTLDNLTPSTVYLWTVTAVGDGTNYTNSKESATGEFTTKAATYTITYVTNGGTNVESTSGIALPNPLPTTKRDHYTFEGWFTDVDCTQAATAGAEINANTTLYAKWTPIIYTVSFDAGSGTCTTESTQGNFETGITLPTATPCDYASTNGWNFVGWSETTVSETTVRPLIYAGTYKPTKNITLYAVYAKTGTAQGAAGEFILSLQYESTTYYVGQTYDGGKLSAETEQTNAARFTIEDNYLHYEGGYISHVAQGSANMTKKADKAEAQAWTIAENGNTITFTSTTEDTRGLGFNYNSGSPRFAAYNLNEKVGETIKYPSTFTKTSVSGDNVQITTYNSKPSCEAPVPPTWNAATINRSSIQVECGSKTLLNASDPKGPATITFNGYNLQNAVTVTASNGFLVSINKTNDAAYSSTVTVKPIASGENQGKITQNVYVIAQAPAQSGNYDGTITLTGTDITNGSQVINVTAAVTCTQYTITWSVNGDDSHQVIYSPGDALQLPSISVTPCDGMEHVGWTDKMGYVHGTDILFTETTDMTVTRDKTYYAVFATPTSSDGGAETTLDFTNQSYADKATVTSLTINAVTVTFSKGTNDTNAPKYYKTGTAVRVYGGNTFTVSSDNTISKIAITFSSGEDSNKITTDVGTYDTNTWTGSANEITFTIGGTSGNRRIKSITVTSAGGGASHYTNYTTTCESKQLETPTNLQATDITYNGATLTWDAVAGANKYKVVINGTENISETNSYTTRALKQQTAYTWTVQAIGNGTTFTNSEISEEATVTTGTALVITWSVSTITSTTTITKGQPIGANLKTPTTPAACEGKYFMGWSATNTVKSDGSDFTPITSDIVPETNVTYYAVFAEPTGNGGAQDELFSESFNDMNGKGGNDGTWNGSIATTKLESFGDWTLSSVYKASACIKLGTTSLAGSATTPVLGINGNATLTFNAGAWNGTSENLTINLQIVGEGSIAPSSVTLTKGQFTTYTANIKGANADTKVKFSAATKNDNRFFLDEVKVSGGTGNTTYTDYSTSCGTYTVTFYGFNSGGYTTICNNNPAEIEVAQGETYQIPACEPTFDPAKLGRTFAGTWNTQVDGKGTAYKPGDEIANVSNDITLYAQWALNTSENTTLPTDVEDLATTDIVVTDGKTLTIPEGKTITINSLTLKGGLLGEDSKSGYAMPSVVIPEGATLVRKNTTINLDLVVNSDSWYPFAVPFAVANNGNIDYLDPVLKAASIYNTHFAIKTYDGANRAIVGTDQKNNWVKVLQTEGLQPGKGYIISAMTYPDKDTATIRIPMTVPNEWLANGEQESITVKEQTTTRNQVAVTAYTGQASDPNTGGHQRHAGWNFVANPYLANFAGTNASGSFTNGEIIINKGDYSYGGEDVPYVTIPTYNFAHYYQVKLSEATLSPAYSFFVQVGKTGTMSFDVAGRQAAPAGIAAHSAEERPVKMDVDIILSDNHSSDQTGIIICDRYSEAYEIGRDLEKMFGSAYNLSVYTLMADNTPLAFQALAIRSNMQVIPVGYRTPAQGEYTFRLNEATSSIDLLNEQYEQLVLVDYQTGDLTNLLISDYTFYSERTQADNRFAIYAVPRQNAPTDLPNAIGQDKQAQKILHNGHLYILRDGNVYNGNGQIVK